jgi:hypothetical protein
MVLPLLMGWLLHRVLAPARAIWRGDASRVPDVPRVQPYQRTYLPYLLWFAPLAGGVGLFSLAGLVFTLFPDSWLGLVFGVPGLALTFVAPAFMLVHLFACLFNRPRFLITPVCRNDRGWVEAIWRRLHRRRSDALDPR